MSLVDNTQLEKLTATTNGKINEQVVNYAKKFLYLQLEKYVIDGKQHEMIKEKIQNMKIELLSLEDFKETHYKCGGSGFLPGGFQYKGVVYFRNDVEFTDREFHNLIHEMLHDISDNGDKVGLCQRNEEKHYTYGLGFNEAFTEYLTSVILDDSFGGYSQDFNYIIQMFMILTNLDIKELFNLYISKEEWLSDEIINTFNPNDNELVGLIVEYDNKVLKKGTFNPNNVLQFLFNSIKIKINNNEKIDTEKLMELLKQYCNYYYDIDRELDASIGIDLAEILDSLGTYRNKISR